MTARGVDFLEVWIGENASADPSDAGVLGAKLIAEAAVAGFTLADMELSEETVEDYIREAIVHLAEPGTPGD
jgi:energy-converting hydrogenase Eha subunit B